MVLFSSFYCSYLKFIVYKPFDVFSGFHGKRFKKRAFQGFL